MLSAKNRLSLRYERTRLEKEGQTKRTPLFTLIYLLNPKLQSPRFAFLIGKKAVRLSTARHALKRLLADTLRQHLAELPSNLEAIVIPSPRALAIPKEELAASLLSLISHL